MSLPDHSDDSWLCPSVALVGTGVVGRAILRAHTDAKISVAITDLNQESVDAAVDELRLDVSEWTVSVIELGSTRLTALVHASFAPQSLPWLVIESIAEKLQVKQTFFQQAERTFGSDAVLCSNTSTLRIRDLCNGISIPERVCGMHFFMPVSLRPAVEVIRGELTSDATIQRCRDHVLSIKKRPLEVRDSPGFIVNRLLSPYLNQSLMLLAHGISADRIENAALRYGMPISPLELIDWIGTRTMFDAGRVFWQAFPDRIDPSPIVPALVKSKRGGRSTGSGLYNYVDGRRSVELARETIEIVDKYRLESLEMSDDDLLHLLAVPMWIEANLAAKSNVISSVAELDFAMQGGLGYQSEHGWLAFFRAIGRKTIVQATSRWESRFRSMRADTCGLERLI